MANTSVGLKILLFLETIVGVRVLLFTVPVLINKFTGKTFAPGVVGDWFVIVLTLSALLYFLVGLFSLIGDSKWKLFHYVVVVLIFMLTLGLLNVVHQNGAPLKSIYFIPLFFSIFVTIFINILTPKAVKG